MSQVKNQKLEYLLWQQPSQLLAEYAAKANKVECNLAIGQPEMDPPAEIHSKIIEMIDNNHYAGYVPSIGNKKAREAVANYFKSLNFTNVDINNVALTNGARSMISYTLITLCRGGDWVLWFGPGYTYADTIKLLGFNHLMVKTQEKIFSPDIELLESSIKMVESYGHLGAVIINNPVNPTGRVWSQDELEALAKVLTKYKVFIIADEVYAGLVFDNIKFVPFATINDELTERIITIGSGSKCLRIPGYRLGFSHGPENFIEALNKTIANLAGCPNVFALIAAQELAHYQEHCQTQLSSLLKKRQIIIDWCQQHNLELTPPQGAFYAFVNVAPILKIKKIKSALELTEALLKCGVGVIPGEAFGDYDEWIRLSYAGPEEILKQGLQLISNYINSN